MHRLRPIALASGLLAASLAAPACAQPVIDDFETGSFQMTATPLDSASQVVSAPAHAVSPMREVELRTWSGGGLASTALLQAGVLPDDQVRVTFGTFGGDAIFRYVPSAPIDLTAGGLNDRVEIAFSAITTGSTLDLSIWDDAGGTGGAASALQVGANEFTFQQFLGVDLTRVSRIEARLQRSGSGGTYDLRDIRAMRRHSRWLRFDIPTATRTVPPFPLDPFAFGVTDVTPSDVQSIRLLDATKTATGAAAGLALTATDSGGDAGGGEVGHVSVAWNEAGVPFASTGFDLRVDVSAVSGVEPVPFLIALPAVASTPNGLALSFALFHPAEAGGESRLSERQVLLDALPGQALAFDDVRVHEVGGSAFASGGAFAVEPAAAFRVTFELKPAGDVDPGEPLFEIALTGSGRPTGTTSVPKGTPAVSQTLTAIPSVTRDGTELRLARPAEAPGRIDLFDAAGRRVRGLALERGESAKFWDGRDASGRITEAGVYFACFADRARRVSARVVRAP